MIRHIVYTRSEGKVSVIYPSLKVMRYLCNGGGRLSPARNQYEIDKMVAHGSHPSFAKRWIHGLTYGGHTTAEAYGLVCSRSIAKDGMAPELGVALPLDRWFRDAWVRSGNGGPITIDLERAREIQAKKIYWTHKNFKIKASGDNELALLTGRNYFVEIPELELEYWRREIVIAKSLAELRAIWPSWLM